MKYFFILIYIPADLMSFEKLIIVDKDCLTVFYEKQFFRFTIIDREKIISVLY